MNVKFNSSETFFKVDSYTIYANMITLIDENLIWDLSGFILYEDDKTTVIRDCSDFIYKWNIYKELEHGVTLTNSETDREPEPGLNKTSPVEEVFPLNNDELTSCVADLMFETSLMKLGMEVE